MLLKITVAFSMLLISFLTPFQSSAYSATAKAGASCSPKGKTQVVGSVKFTCVLSNKKLVWNKGVKVSPPTTTTTVPALPKLTALGSSAPCRLPYSNPNDPWGNWSDGFSDRSHRLPSTGTVKSIVLFVDFPGDSATSATIPQRLIDYTQQTTAFYKSESFGKLNLQFTAYPKILHITTDPTTYGMTNAVKYNPDGTPKANNSNQYLQDALNAGLNAGVDFSGYVNVIVIPPKDNITIEFGPGVTWGVPLNPNIPNIYNAVLGQKEQASMLPWVWLAHELSNNMGLQEPWGVNTPIKNVWSISFVGGVDLLWGGGLPIFDGIESLGWEKWLLGWVSDSQVACVDTISTSIFDLAPLETTDSGTKIISIKLNTHKTIVVEYRTTAGFDSVPAGYSGAFVYTVDTSMNSDLTPSDPSFVALGTKMYSPTNQLVGTIQAGESITYQGNTISILSMDNKNLYVKVVTGN